MRSPPTSFAPPIDPPLPAGESSLPPGVLARRSPARGGSERAEACAPDAAAVPVSASAEQGAFLSGRLLACCVQLQVETVGGLRLASAWYLATMRRPATHLTFIVRVARHYVGLTVERLPDAAPAALWLQRELESMLVRLRELGGVPRELRPPLQAHFRDGFSTQWRRQPPDGRVARRRLARSVLREVLASAHAGAAGPGVRRPPELQPEAGGPSGMVRTQDPAADPVPVV